MWVARRRPRLLEGLWRAARKAVLWAYGHAGIYKSSLGRRLYWRLRAKGLDQQWGEWKGDYEVLGGLLASLAPKRLLDVGCGSGRLFPLYQSCGVQEVVGQDIAQEALGLARTRYNGPRVRLLHAPVTELDFPESYFDLAICNRVLQHIPPAGVAAVIAAICRLCRAVYVSESLPESAECEEFYLFRHDYVGMFGTNGLVPRMRGRAPSFTGECEWLLFGQTAPSGERRHDRS